jgi:Tfp pilus assembly protein PilX
MVEGITPMGSETMGNNVTRANGNKHARRSSGFTLIASLLMLLMLSGIAVGLLMMVNTEGKVGGTDLQNNLAFHAAEGGIEKMYSDLSYVFQTAQSPTAAQICAVGSTGNQPVMVGVTWTQYSVMPGTTQGSTCPSSLTSTWGQISSGPDQGLWAQVIPVNMLATAQFPGGQEVSMTRSAQVALIPVFQYGVFCEGDCGFFDSPNLNFNGRIHTNSDLYLGVSGGYTLTFHNKLEAYGNVITEALPNGLAVTGSSWDDTGNVYIPTANNGCSTTTTNCVLKAANSNPPSSPYGDGSLQGAGGNPPQSTYNTSSWNTFSKTTANKMLINGNYGSSATPGTGAKKLSMPFVSGTTFPFEIIRRALSSDTPALSQSREENLAQIHVLLSDDPSELPSGSVRLANITAAEATATGGTTSNPYGISVTPAAGGAGNAYIPAALGALSGSNAYAMYFAAASNGYLPDTTTCNGAACPVLVCPGPVNCKPQYLPADWLFAPATPQTGAATLVPTSAPGAPVMNAGASPAPTLALCSGTVANLPAGCPAVTPVAPYLVVGNSANASTWNLIDGYLYVEYKDASGAWHNVTSEWLGLGFARGVTSPTAPGTNPINPNAILLLQTPADRAGNGGAPDATGIAPSCSAWNAGHTACTGTWSQPLPPEVLKDAASTNPYFGVTNNSPAPAAGSTLNAAGQSISIYNWYPINFYDAREGEPRDNSGWNNDSCTTNGLMNAVEIDVGNLNQWLLGNIGTSGTNVDYAVQNGYVLYFSDRRGMLVNPTKGYKSGDSGLEDVVNSSSAAGVPDGVLEPVPAGHTLSPEDVNQNGVLDEYGTANLGLGQWSGTFSNSTGLITGAVNQDVQIIAAAPDNPYSPRMASCVSTGRKNWVSGARHVLKLVDGSLGNVPISPNSVVSGGVTYHGGFTVASENPVYIQGDYNTNPTDTYFTAATAAGPGPDETSPVHSAASVIADAVTILSKDWVDLNSMTGIPTKGSGGNRQVTHDTYYRVAVAGGKNLAFPFPSWENGTDYGFGTDGGIHNFLRFLEDWSGNTLNYGGSLVSLYYATYNTGVFKCCQYSVYSPPTRNYIFDVDFTNPAGLPPGTPMFRDVESLSYRQVFASRQTGQ